MISRDDLIRFRGDLQYMLWRVEQHVNRGVNDGFRWNLSWDQIERLAYITRTLREQEFPYSESSLLMASADRAMAFLS